MSEPESDDVCRRCDKTYCEHIGFACPIGGTSFRGHDMTESLEAQLLAAQSENQRLREEMNSAQANAAAWESCVRLRENAENKSPCGHHMNQSYSPDGKGIQIRCYVCERDTLASQVATLTAERDEALAIVHQYGGFHSRTPREMEIEAALNQAFPTDWSSEDNAISELLVLIEAGRGRLWQAANERDQLRIQNAALMADCVVMRGALHGMLNCDPGNPMKCLWDAKKALATDRPGAPLIEAVRKDISALRIVISNLLYSANPHPKQNKHMHAAWVLADRILSMDSPGEALAELEKFLPKV